MNYSKNNNKNKVIESIVIEAGTELPKAEAFFTNRKSTGKFITDISLIDAKKIGETIIELEIDGQNYTSLLIIENKIPPAAKPVELYIFKNTEITPEDLAAEIESALPVTVSFASPPDLKQPGRQDIKILIANENGLVTEIDSGIYIFDVADEIRIEFGTKINVKAKDFIYNYIEPGDFDFDIEINGFDPEKLGDYPVKLKLGQYEADSVLIIEDTIPPSAIPMEKYIFKGVELAADDLAAEIKDATKVTCSFASDLLPDFFQAGRQDATILLKDEGNNVTEVNSGFYVLEVKDKIIIELGTVDNLTEKDFIKNYPANDNLTDLFELFLEGEINFSKTGAYPVTLKTGVYSAQASVIIEDTTPPVANVRNNLWIYINKSISAQDFVYNITDASPVNVKYKTQPDFSAEGKQTVYIILADAYNNITEYNAILTVIWDKTPPVISGRLNKWVVEGGSVSYNNGITVTDDYDQNVRLVIDNSGVNLNQAGVYPVIYSATDESGNRSEANGTVTVRAIDMDLINEMSDEILAQIITGDMGDYDKAHVIYKWVYKNIRYNGSATGVTIEKASYEGFSKGRGDCYVFMAVSHVLLTRANINNLIVKRIGGTTEHSWILVNAGDGWHHFDTCPTPNNAVTIDQRFMFTESQAVEYTKILSSQIINYYIYDKSTVPEVVE